MKALAILACSMALINAGAQAQQWPRSQHVPAPRGGVIPPIEYDYPYQGVLILQRGDKEKMEKDCPIQTPMTIACAFRRLGVPDGQPSPYCRIVIANDELLEERIRERGFWSYDIILRHEMGHCNGWGPDHSRGRTLAEAAADERAGAQENERIRKRDAQSTALYSTYLQVRHAWSGWQPQPGMTYHPWAGWRHLRAAGRL